MKNKICVLFVCLIFITACGDKNPFVERVYLINFKNTTTKSISFFDSRTYPDTTLPSEKPYFGTCRPNSTSDIESKQKWEKNISDTPRDTLSIFIIDTDTIINKPWVEIKNQYKILKRYDLSLQDLQNRNWTITYP
jgi:hypothetical protein